jgi:hypothetical protein
LSLRQVLMARVCHALRVPAIRWIRRFRWLVRCVRPVPSAMCRVPRLAIPATLPVSGSSFIWFVVLLCFLISMCSGIVTVRVMVPLPALRVLSIGLRMNRTVYRLARALMAVNHARLYQDAASVAVLADACRDHVPSTCFDLFKFSHVDCLNFSHSVGTF